MLIPRLAELKVVRTSPDSFRKGGSSSLDEMLKSYEINAGKRLVTVKFAGTWEGEDVENYLTQLHSDARFTPTYDELVDLTEVESVAFTDQQMMNLSTKCPFFSNSRRAFVANTRSQTHAAYLHRIIRKGTLIRVFARVEEAVEWIAESHAAAAIAR